MIFFPDGFRTLPSTGPSFKASALDATEASICLGEFLWPNHKKLGSDEVNAWLKYTVIHVGSGSFPFPKEF